MGRPPLPKDQKFVAISARIPPLLAKQLERIREQTGETISAQIEDGLKRVVAAHERRHSASEGE